MEIDTTILIFYFIALGVLLGCYIIFGLFFIRKFYVMNKEHESTREKYYIFLIYGLCFFFLCIGRIFYTIFDFATEFNVSENMTSENLIMWKIGNGFQLVTLGLLIGLLEKRILHGRDKYLLFFIYITFVSLGMIATDLLLATFFLFLPTIMVLYIPIAYIYIAIKSDGIIRKRALLALFGFIILFVGSLMLNEYILIVIVNMTGLDRIQIHAISHIIKCVGVILIFLGFQ